MLFLCLAFLIILSTGTLGETTKSLDGFWGIPWGTSIEDAEKAMLAKDGVTIDEKTTTDNVLVFDGGFFGGRPLAWSYLKFHHGDGLYGGTVIFKPNPGHLIDDYDDWIKDLKEKYGRPTKSARSFDDPYYEGDGYEEDAVRLGKAYLGAYWDFPVAEKEANNIIINITQKRGIEISFVWGEVSKKAEDEAKKKDQNDY